MAPKSNLNPRTLQDGERFTVRPFPTAVNHKTFLRINLTRTALVSNDLKSGELCQVSAIDPENGDGAMRWLPAIAWLSGDPHLHRYACLISEPVRALLGVEVEHKIRVRKYFGHPLEAEKVTLREIQPKNLMKSGVRDGWRYFLEHILMEAKYVFEGLIFYDVEYKGSKRSFRVEKVTPLTEGTAEKSKTSSFDPKAVPFVPVSVISEPTSIKLVTETVQEPPKKVPVVAKPATKPKGTSPDTSAALDTTRPTSSNVTFGQIGGLSIQIKSLRSLLTSVLEDANEFARKGLIPPRGILLYGPPGTGKTMMLRAATNEIRVKSFILDGKVMGKYMGESESSIRKIFAEARKNQPSIIFMDEVDSLAPKRSQGEGSEGRVVATLLTEMDALESPNDDGSSTRVAIVAATNRPNAIDEALRRAGRFEKEVEVGIPDVDARREVLEILMRKLDFTAGEKDKIITALASRTHGYVGADLEALVRTAFTLALERRRNLASTNNLLEGVASLSITDGAVPSSKDVILDEADFEVALKSIKPTAMREIFIEAPKVRWSDIGGNEEVKQRLREAVEWPLTHPEVFARLGGTPRKGLLLYGPPGCSKTLTAKALATEAGLNFMAVKGPELFSMYVGESERAVREVFRKARAASPSIIFFDEIDSLTASREGSKGGGVNVLTTLLNEMDGIESLKNVVVLAATNRPEIIDPALLRPGRLDTILYVGPPDFEARRQILEIKIRKMTISPDVDICELAHRLDGFSGAEIVNVCDEAIHYAMRESFDIDAVAARHFEAALRNAEPQITAAMREQYEEWSVGGIKKI